MENRVSVELNYIQNVNYSLVLNHIPVCRFLDVKSLVEEDLDDVQISVSGKYVLDYSSPVFACIQAGKTLRLSDFVIMPKADILSEITEGIVSTFSISITSKSEVFFQKDFDIDIMPFDQWHGTSVLPQCLASFVMPNQPAIKNIILKAAAKLMTIAGTKSFVEYQDGDPQTVLKQIAAIFAAIHEENLVYRAMPASYEKVGQKITLADQIIEQKLANCIELTLLMASALEAVGIYSGIVMIKGHAFLAIWLDEICAHHAIIDDCSYITKKCSEGISEMIVLECTELAQTNTSFEHAQALAAQHLLDVNKFDMFIDIKRCRLEGIKPLPARIKSGETWKAPHMEELESGSCDVKVSEHTKYDLNKAYNKKEKASKFDIWENKLLDFSLRNNFLNLSLRTRAIQFISFDIGTIEDYLQDGAEYCVMPMPDVPVQLKRDGALVHSASIQQLSPLVKNDIEKDKVLHTYLDDAESQQKLKNIYRSSKVSVEETGSNSLYLAIGLLRWYEKPNSPNARYAPILLLPLEIIYKRGRYFIRKRDEEIALNITLVEYIRQNYGIVIKGINPLPLDNHGVNVPLIFAQIRDALKEQKNWDIEEECVLGTFSFNKFLMWNDIHSNREKLNKNQVVSSLVAGKLTWKPNPVAVNLSDDDKTLKPESLSLPVAVDSSQMAAVLEAGKGSTFILYGPPGTGKSQTITNLIANALYQGKRVLFVAEKMAALNVVQSRLEKIDLGAFCLELHSNKVAKKHILEQLDKALNALRIKAPDNVSSRSEELFERRKVLIEYLDALHNYRDESGLTLFECIKEYERIKDVTPLDVKLEGNLLNFKSEQIRVYKEILDIQLPTVVEMVGQPCIHPLKELEISKEGLAQRALLEQLLVKGSTLSKQFGKLRTLVQTCLGDQIADTSTIFFRSLRMLGCISSFPVLNSHVLDLAFDDGKCHELNVMYHEREATESLYNNLIQANRPELFEEDIISLLKEWNEIQGKWFIPRYFASKSFINRLRFYNKDFNKDNIESILDEVLQYKKLKSSVDSNSSYISEATGKDLTTSQLGNLLAKLPDLRLQIEEFTTENGLDKEALVSKLKEQFNKELKTKLSGTERLYEDWQDLTSNLSKIVTINWSDDGDFSNNIATKFKIWEDNTNLIDKWFNWCSVRQQLLDLGIEVVVKAIETKEEDLSKLSSSFFKGFYKALAQRIIQAHPNLIAFEGMMFDKQIVVYKELTNEFQELSKKLLYSRLSANIPKIHDDIDNNGEIGLLLRNIANGARGMSIRQLLDSIPNLLPRLCPCMLMSPMSVAQYIDLDQKKFDLVVFDEASQMPTSEAVGAIARGNALVVVGDPKQMPPTSFFSSNNINEDDEDIDDLESILQDCQALGMPSLQLNWHYRSRHESLIAFSNNEYYNGELITFPSTDDQQTKLSFVKIDGVYEKGSTRCNRAEAEAIVKEVVRRIKNKEQLSIGIIAFSSTQQSLIEDLLSERIESDKNLTQLADAMYEPIFVKNLENVQGDERDVILFSIGYGPDANGKISMNFGPLNKEGGERRLNVAVSRARKEMIVFSTMTASQINLKNTKSKGVEGLKHFLEYAEKQILVDKARTNTVRHDNIIQEQIAKQISALGYDVKTQIGRSDFKVDIAVVNPKDPSDYLLGILLDGDVYRTTQTTRDREIVQPSVLSSLNWNVVRIWTVDWFKHPDEVISRIDETIKSIQSGLTSEHSHEDSPESSDNVTPAQESCIKAIKSFCITSEDVIRGNDNTKLVKYPSLTYKHYPEIEMFVDAVIRNEQPIMYTLLCKRVANEIGISRVTSTSQDIVDQCIGRYFSKADRGTKVICENETFFNEWNAYRPNKNPPRRRSIEDIPSIELEVVIIETVEHNVSISEDNLTLRAAQRMGFARRGTNVDAALKDVLNKLIKEGKLKENDCLISRN